MDFKYESFDIRDSRYGSTADSVWVGFEGCNAIVLSAAGGELRVVLSLDKGETRNSALMCVSFTVGQHANTRSSLGFGNPALGAFRSTSTSGDGHVSKDLKQSREWWFGFDRETGWVICGAGSQVGKRILLAHPLPQIAWTHVSFSNWEEPINVSIRKLCVMPAVHLHANKFNKFGDFERFEGVTTVSSFKIDHPLGQAMVVIQNLIRENPRLAGYYTLLPPSSFHVTAYSLHCLTGAEYDKSKAQSDEIFERTRRAVTHARSLLPKSLTFLPTGFNRSGSVALTPTLETGRALASWRKAVGKEIGETPHSGYRFHSTLAYTIYPVSSLESRAALEVIEAVATAILRAVGPIQLLPPEFSRFRDMSAFPS